MALADLMRRDPDDITPPKKQIEHDDQIGHHALLQTHELYQTKTTIAKLHLFVKRFH